MLMLSGFSERILGTWTIQRCETRSPEQQGATLYYIGTIVFEKDGSGVQYLQYDIMGLERNDTLQLNWLATDKYINIISDDAEFSKSWIYE